MICTRCNLLQARMSILLKDSSSSSAGVSKQSRSSIYILNIRSWCNLPMLAAPLSFFILIRPSSARRRHSHWTPLKYLVSGQWCSWIFAFLALVLGLQEVLSLRELCVHGNWILRKVKQQQNVYAKVTKCGFSHFLRDWGQHTGCIQGRFNWVNWVIFLFTKLQMCSRSLTSFDIDLLIIGCNESCANHKWFF